MELEHVIQALDGLKDRVLSHRHYLHTCPELSYEEVKTGAYVRKILDQLGISYTYPVAKTGIVATIEGAQPGPTLGLRADMDGLPIQEETGLAFASKHKGKMHACGHDIHTANLLGLGEFFQGHKHAFKGQVKLIFQPGEESGGGGREIVKEGILEDVDLCLAGHVWPIDLGSIRLVKGYSTGSSDRLDFKVRGKAAHSSKPKEGVDALYITSKVLNALYSMKDRLANPSDVYTLSLGKIQGGTAINILADQVEVQGMLRSSNPDIREEVITWAKKFIEEIPPLYGGQGTFIFKAGYPSVYNDPLLQEKAQEFLNFHQDMLLKGLKLGIDIERRKKYILDQGPIELGAEDFGFYSQVVPSLFLWIGLGNGAPAHNNKFHIEDENIHYMTRVLGSLAMYFLNQGGMHEKN